jgi:hypothetical protein
VAAAGAAEAWVAAEGTPAVEAILAVAADIQVVAEVIRVVVVATREAEAMAVNTCTKRLFCDGRARYRFSMPSCARALTLLPPRMTPSPQPIRIRSIT